VEAVTAIRFDADRNRVAKEDPRLTEEWGSYEGSVWYLTDGMSNGRWLFVDHAENGNGVPVGIGRGIYTKYLSSAAARSLAEALLVAANEAEAFESARKQERKARARRERECVQDGGHQWGPPPLTVTHATGMVGPNGSSSFWVCRRCDHSAWIDDAPLGKAGA
jgi:hypothetical protein